MTLAKTLSWSIALSGAIALVPCAEIVAQQGSRRPDAQVPRVAVIAALDDSAPALAGAIADVAQRRIPQTVSRDRLWLVSTKDINLALYSTPEWDPKPWPLEDYRGLGKLVRAAGTVVLTVRGRRDSLDVIAGIVLTRMLPIDTVHFQASSPAAAVDSIVARLLANPRLRRGAT